MPYPIARETATSSVGGIPAKCPTPLTVVCTILAPAATAAHDPIITIDNLRVEFESDGKIVTGQWLSVAVAHYARKLNRMWTKRNQTFLRVVALLKPASGARISVDYREDVSLEL